jgi:DNA-binding NarL/FixJ family response regulator
MAQADVDPLDSLRLELAPPQWRIVIRGPDPARGEPASPTGTTLPVHLVASGEAHEHRAPRFRTLLADGSTTLRAPAARPARPLLTRRQRHVLDGFDRGLCDKEIAQELEIAVSTVRSHARSIYEKLEVGSRTAAVHAARALGLI